MLRSSYSRYLRDIKKMPSGSAGNKKKWHLAEAMSFLMPFMGQQKKTVSNMTCKRVGDVPASQEVPNQVTAVIEEAHEDILESGTDTATGSTSTPEGVEEINPRKKKPKTAAEVVAEPIAAYFKSLSKKPATEEHPMMSYFKGLMPEINKLSATSQRRFKMDVVEKLNYYLDIEEGLAISTPFSGPSSIASDGHSASPAQGTDQIGTDEFGVIQIGGYANPNRNMRDGGKMKYVDFHDL